MVTLVFEGSVSHMGGSKSILATVVVKLGIQASGRGFFYTFAGGLFSMPGHHNWVVALRPSRCSIDVKCNLIPTGISGLRTLPPSTLNPKP